MKLKVHFCCIKLSIRNKKLCFACVSLLRDFTSKICLIQTIRQQQKITYTRALLSLITSQLVIVCSKQKSYLYHFSISFLYSFFFLCRYCCESSVFLLCHVIYILNTLFITEYRDSVQSIKFFYFYFFSYIQTKRSLF